MSLGDSGPVNVIWDKKRTLKGAYGPRDVLFRVIIAKISQAV